MLKNCAKIEILRIKKMITFPNDESKRKFEQLRNEKKNKLIEKRKFYDKELGNSNDSKRMFQVFNKFCGKKKTSSNKLEVNDLNNFFDVTGPQLSKKIWGFQIC